MNVPEPVAEVQRLFVRNSDVLEGFIIGLLPDFTLSKDILHEVFLTLTEKAADYRPGSDFLAWAKSVARFKVLKQLTARKSVPRLVDPKALESVLAASSELDRTGPGDRDALVRCMEELAPRAREIVELRYSEPLRTPRDIAKKLSWTSGAVRVALARARKFLFDCAQRRLAEQET